MAVGYRLHTSLDNADLASEGEREEQAADADDRGDQHEQDDYLAA